MFIKYFKNNNSDLIGHWYVWKIELQNEELGEGEKEEKIRLRMWSGWNTNLQFLLFGGVGGWCGIQ